MRNFAKYYGARIVYDNEEEMKLEFYNNRTNEFIKEFEENYKDSTCIVKTGEEIMKEYDAVTIKKRSVE